MLCDGGKLIVHLNGWPGVGKKTIGSALAEMLAARFVDNHLLHDVAIVCAGFESPERWAVYDRVRAAAYEGLFKRPKDEIFVMTNALCRNAPRELKAWEHIVELAVSRDVPLVPVVLEAQAEENIRRLGSAERVGRKLTDPAELRGYFAMDAIQCPEAHETLILDVTRLHAVEAAECIRRHI